MPQESNTFSVPTLVESVGLIVALGFVVSVIYDWGFVFALGLNFAYLPSTTADHFHSGLLWFPPLLGLVLAYFAIEYQLQRVEGGRTEQEIIQSSHNPEKIRKFRESPRRLLPWIAILGLFTWILVGDFMASVQPIFVSIVWIGFAEWCYSAPLIKHRRSRNVQLCFTFLPVVGILAFFSGYNAAVDAAIRKPSEITIEREPPLVAVSGKILRTFEKGLLLLEEKDVISFMPWEQISAIHRNTAYRPFRGALCEWFKLCPQSNDLNSNKPVQPITKGGG
jgi:hypothetical protein